MSTAYTHAARAVGLAVLMLAVSLAPAPAATAAPGDLDASFGSGGAFTGPQQTRFPPYGEQAVDVDALGRPLVAWTFDDGAAFDEEDLELAVARLTASGQLDPSFNPGGTTPGIRVVDFTDAPSENVLAAGVAPGPGGTVVALGAISGQTITASIGPKIGLVRLTADGSYDSGFGGDGRVVQAALGSYQPDANDLAVDSSGRPLVAGTSYFGCPVFCDSFQRVPFVARFTGAGALDASWGGGDGFFQHLGTADGELFAVETAADGGVVAAGRDGVEALALKLDAAGAPATIFSGDGIATTSLGVVPGGCGGSATGFGVADGGSGRVLLAGQATNGDCSGHFALARFGAGGGIDASWGNGTPASGVVWLADPQATRGTDLAVQGDGKVLATGKGAGVVLARLTGTGVLDPDFAPAEPTPGLRQTALGANGSAGWRLALTASGQPLVSGWRWASGTDVKPVVLRYENDAGAGGGGGGGEESGGGGGGGAPPGAGPGPGSGGGAGGAPPVADFSFKQRSPTLARTVWFNGAGSRPAPGRGIVSYAWDLTSDGRYDFVAGPRTPAISTTVRRPGNYTATLTVIDSLGASDSFSQKYTVGGRDANRGPSFTTFEQPATGPNQADTPGCVKTIAFAIVEVNGRGSASQCFRLEYASPDQELSIGDFISARAAAEPTARASAGPVKQLSETRVLYRAEIDGPVAINGLPVPLPSGYTTRYEAWKGRVDLGRVEPMLPLPGGQRVRLAGVDLAFDVPSSGSVQLPPLSTTSLPRFAGLKLGGSVGVRLRNAPPPTGTTLGKRGPRAEADIDLALTLPNFLSDSMGGPIQGEMSLTANNTLGVRLASAGLEVPAAYIGPMRVDEVSLAYLGPPEDKFQAAANFHFPGLSVLGAPPPTRGIGFRQGAFDYAGLAVRFDPPSQPVLFPGVNLRRIEGRFEVDPIVISGGLGISVVGVIAIDGDMLLALASPQEPFTIPAGTAPPGLKSIEERRLTSFAFAIGAEASLITPVGDLPFANAHVFYHYPNFLELGGNWRFRLGGDSAPYVEMRGGVGGWASFSPNRFNLEGNNAVCFGIPTPFPFDDVELCQELFGLVSSRGAFACAKNISIAPVPPFFLPEIGLGWKWGEGGIPDITLFSCRPSNYREVQPPLGARAARVGRGAYSFALPGDLDAAQLRVTGAGGAPAVDVRGPDGTQITVPLDGEGAADTTGRDFLAMRMDDRTIQIGLRRPAAGRWTVTPRASSAPLGSVAVAEAAPAAKIRARVSGRGQQRELRYRLEPAPGRSIRFVEQGARTYSEIGVARGDSGTIPFSPAPGASGRRQIVALVEQDGVTVERVEVARYSAPADAGPPKPQRLRVTRRGDELTLSWRAVRGVDAYGVVLRLADRERIFRVVQRPRLSLRGFHRLERGLASIQSLVDGRPPGLPAKARIKPV